MADALVSVSQDALDRAEPVMPSQDPLVTVFVDAASASAAPALNEAVPEPPPPRAWVEGGIRVGPNTLEKLLCLGAVELIGVDQDFNPIAATPAHRAIPPKLRRAILARDGGCVIDGCDSTYRLQPHHLRPASNGGTTAPDNLATVCWFHHRDAIERASTSELE